MSASFFFVILSHKLLAWDLYVFTTVESLSSLEDEAVDVGDEFSVVDIVLSNVRSVAVFDVGGDAIDKSISPNKPKTKDIWSRIAGNNSNGSSPVIEIVPLKYEKNSDNVTKSAIKVASEPQRAGIFETPVVSEAVQPMPRHLSTDSISQQPKAIHIPNVDLLDPDYEEYDPYMHASVPATTNLKFAELNQWKRGMALKVATDASFEVAKKSNFKDSSIEDMTEFAKRESIATIVRENDDGQRKKPTMQHIQVPEDSAPVSRFLNAFDVQKLQQEAAPTFAPVPPVSSQNIWKSSTRTSQLMPLKVTSA